MAFTPVQPKCGAREALPYTTRSPPPPAQPPSSSTDSGHCFGVAPLMRIQTVSPKSPHVLPGPGSSGLRVRLKPWGYGLKAGQGPSPAAHLGVVATEQAVVAGPHARALAVPVAATLSGAVAPHEAKVAAAVVGLHTRAVHAALGAHGAAQSGHAAGAGGGGSGPGGALRAWPAHHPLERPQLVAHPWSAPRSPSGV